MLGHINGLWYRLNNKTSCSRSCMHFRRCVVRCVTHYCFHCIFACEYSLLSSLLTDLTIRRLIVSNQL